MGSAWAKSGIFWYSLGASTLLALISIGAVQYWKFSHDPIATGSGLKPWLWAWELPPANNNSQETVTLGDIIGVVISIAGITVPIILTYFSSRERDIQVDIAELIADGIQRRGIAPKDISPAIIHARSEHRKIHENFGALGDPHKNDSIESAAALDDLAKIVTSFDTKTGRYRAVSPDTLNKIVGDEDKICSQFRDYFETNVDKSVLLIILIIIAFIALAFFIDMLVRLHDPSKHDMLVFELFFVVFTFSMNVSAHVIMALGVFRRARVRRTVNNKISTLCDHAASVVSQHKLFEAVQAGQEVKGAARLDAGVLSGKPKTAK
jgi:hypothetical protein